VIIDICIYFTSTKQIHFLFEQFHHFIDQKGMSHFSANTAILFLRTGT